MDCVIAQDIFCVGVWSRDVFVTVVINGIYLAGVLLVLEFVFAVLHRGSGF